LIEFKQHIGVPKGFRAPGSKVKGNRGWEPGRKGGRRSTRGRRRGDRKQDSRGGRSERNRGKVMQHCAIFCNQKSAKRQQP